MSKAVTKIDDSSLSNNLTIQPSEYELVKRMYAKGATDDEFSVFIQIANKYRLSPVLKEIWCIKRGKDDAALVITSRDGYLAIAHRELLPDGSKAFDGIQSGTIENEKGELLKAWCEVWRKDMSHSFKSEVKFSEYNQTNSPVWKKYPSAMLIKVAEVFALKRAFTISGVVTQEELGEGYSIHNASSEAEEKLLNKALKEIESALTEKDLLEIWNNQTYRDADFRTNASFTEAMKNKKQAIIDSSPAEPQAAEVVEGEIVGETEPAATAPEEVSPEKYGEFMDLLDVVDTIAPEMPATELSKIRDAVNTFNRDATNSAEARSEIMKKYMDKYREITGKTQK